MVVHAAPIRCILPILLYHFDLNLSDPAMNPVVMGSFNLLMTMLKAYLEEQTQVAISKKTC